MECRIGRVSAIRPKEVEVEVLQLDACATCHARSACTASDMRMRTVTITRDLPLGLSVGDRVRIVADQPRVLEASAYAYIIPLLLIILEAVLLPSLFDIDELSLVGVLLGTVALYAVVLWGMRGHFRKRFSFRIEPLESTLQEVDTLTKNLH